MKVIESDKIVPLFRLTMMNMPKPIADALCNDVQALVNMQSFDVDSQGWINIQDGSPPKNGDYLFCGTEAITNTKSLYSVKYWCNGEIRPFDYAPSITFTHWMPLPDPPIKV